MQRLILFLAGIAGAFGVGFAAASAHLVQGPFIGTAATVLMAHAPALLAVALLGGSSRLLHASALAMVVGLALFSGDLTTRDALGHPLFPGAAPTGGILLIASWLAVAAAAAFRRT